MSEEHITNNENKQPMSIEQAGNYLQDKMKTMPEDTKREASKAPISLALGEDRMRYLGYAISLMEDIPESTKNRWCAIALKSAGLYTTKNVCRMLKQLLVLRISGYSHERIAQHLKTTIDIVKQCETLGVQAACEAIEKRKLTGIPIRDYERRIKKD